MLAYFLRSVLFLVFLTTLSYSQQFDDNMPWPLCGRIAENPPAGWQDTDGCPSGRWGNPNYTDLPINSVFGPRPLFSENDRYDFHRGIDIATPIGTPVFAIADGVVRIAGDHPSYSDPLVQVRHFRPGETSCNSGGCYHSNYMHLSSPFVNVDDQVSKGQLLGYSGESSSGFDHLHFEIRDALPEDPFSSWQRDAINPAGILPYQTSESATITFDSVDSTDPDIPVVQVTVESQRIDINRIELFLYNSSGNIVDQPGNTPDSRGYNVFPSWFDVNVWNRQYTHKDSTNVPWESFRQGGVNECPFNGVHPSSYDAYIHMDAQDPEDYHVGLFNGVRIQTQKFTLSGYYINLTFIELTGPANCIVAMAYFTDGGNASNEWGNCTGNPQPPNDCGNGICDVGEDCDSCPADCISGSGPVCGNGICEASDGEDCNSCPSDCNSKTKGNPSRRFCCGESGLCGNNQCNNDIYSCTENPSESYCCGDSFCDLPEDTFICEIDCGAPPLCGDGTCDAGEDSCSCSSDCGNPPGEICADGLDNDCDGNTDCDDSDCSNDSDCNSSCIPTSSKEKGPRCSDGLDNDCDGLIDGADTDC